MLVFGKGKAFVRIEVFREFVPDVKAAARLAELIMGRLP